MVLNKKGGFSMMIETLIAGGTGFFGWLFGKWQTPRERKKSDLQLINEVLSPLLDSVRQLTEQNNEMVGKLRAEQEEKLLLIEEKSEWIKERAELKSVISKNSHKIKNNQQF